MLTVKWRVQVGKKGELVIPAGAASSDGTELREGSFVSKKAPNADRRPLHLVAVV